MNNSTITTVSLTVNAVNDVPVAANDSPADDSGVLPADAVKVFPLAGDASDAVTPSDNNGVVPTDQRTNQIYLPLISR